MPWRRVGARRARATLSVITNRLPRALPYPAISARRDLARAVSAVPVRRIGPMRDHSFLEPGQPGRNGNPIGPSACVSTTYLGRLSRHSDDVTPFRHSDYVTPDDDRLLGPVGAEEFASGSDLRLGLLGRAKHVGLCVRSQRLGQADGAVGLLTVLDEYLNPASVTNCHDIRVVAPYAQR